MERPACKSKSGLTKRATDWLPACAVNSQSPQWQHAALAQQKRGIMNWLLVGSVGGVTIVNVESGGMTYSAAQKLADEINAMYAAQQESEAK